MKTKICNCCYKEYPAITEFFHTHQSTSDKLRKQCKKCRNKLHRQYLKTKKGKAATKKYISSAKHKQKKKDWALKDRYGITRQQHKSLYIKQNGCCIICKKSVPYNKIQTDHNHKTGKVRGLVCFTCNVLIGYVEKISSNSLVLIINQYLNNNE